MCVSYNCIESFITMVSTLLHTCYVGSVFSHDKENQPRKMDSNCRLYRNPALTSNMQKILQAERSTRRFFTVINEVVRKNWVGEGRVEI